MFKPVYYSIHAIRLTSNKKSCTSADAKVQLYFVFTKKLFVFFEKPQRIFNVLPFFLFVSDSLDRVEPCCLLCRIPSKENASKCTDCKTHNNAPRLYLGGYMEERVQTER